ncbi:MAG: hypothetical protein LBC02_07175, partial [Planctomycetaceae bacterium]|nr:hypothetical protein [Planctomycetaceae bacterium]
MILLNAVIDRRRMLLMMRKRFFFSICFIVFFCFMAAVSNVVAANLEISEGATSSISVFQTLSDSDKYSNKGTLEITDAGSLKITAGVQNIEPLGEGIEGLDLGVVKSSGTIDSAKTIRFQEGSQISGQVISTQNVIFDGASTFDGNSGDKIEAKILVFNASENQDDNGNFLASTVDLSNGAELDIEELVANGSVNIMMPSDKVLELNSLAVQGSGTQFNVSESFTVTGNYTGGAGSTMTSKQGTNGSSEFLGTITLLGGGELVEGTNNLIMQSEISAKELRVNNLTTIAQNLTIYGNFTVMSPESGKESLVTAERGIQTTGKTIVEDGGVLQLKGESSSNMTYFGYYYYNGLFFGGLELQNGATLKTAGDNSTLSIALGDTSEFKTGSKIIAENIHLSGTDTAGSSKQQRIQNSGTLSATGLLQLTTINFENTATGLLEVNGLKLASSSILNLSSNGNNNGGLTFIGDNPFLEITANSSLIALGKTLDFVGVEVINNNSTSGIEAKSLVFGTDSSLAGAGYYNTDATFKKDSKVKLDNSGAIDFGDHAVWLQEGAVIELSIGSNGTGSIVTEGKVTMENGVLLEVTDGSNYNGRTKTFRIIQGSADSVFAELTLANSLFFKLNHTALDDENGLLVEIAKSADMVDYVNSSNQRNLGILIDRLLNDGNINDSQHAVFDALMQSRNDLDYQQSLDSLSGATRENTLLFALSSPWRIPMANIGFHRLPLTLENNRMSWNQTTLDDDEAETIRGQKFFKKPNWNLPKQYLPKRFLP